MSEYIQHHFTGEDCGTQRGQVPNSKPHSVDVEDMGLAGKAGLLGSSIFHFLLCPWILEVSSAGPSVRVWFPGPVPAANLALRKDHKYLLSDEFVHPFIHSVVVVRCLLWARPQDSTMNQNTAPPSWSSHSQGGVRGGCGSCRQLDVT